MITEADVSAYRADGVIVLRQFFDKQWLRELAEGIERNVAAPSKRTLEYVNDPNTHSRFFYDALPVGESDWYDRFMLDSPMGESVGRLMGSSRALAYYISVFVRSPGTRNRTPWHQDQPSWAAAGEQACSLWMSLDPVPQATALEFVRASHRWRSTYQRPDFFISHYEHDRRAALPPFPDIEADREAYDIVSWALEPGDCVVFHGMTVHGGSGNLPKELGRRAVSVQWLGDDARFRLVPGGDDPCMSDGLMAHGLKPGDPMECPVCPAAWRAA